MRPALKADARQLLHPSLSLSILLLVLAFAFGGSSAEHFAQNMLIQIIAILVLVGALAGIGNGDFSARGARFALILVGALGLLMLVQIVPLPRTIWSHLGGRELAGNVLDIIGATTGGRALSVDPERTVLAALALLPGAAMCVSTLRLGTGSRAILAGLIVLGALFSLVLGVLQASLGSNAEQLSPYSSSHVGLPIGLFANTNHQGDMLLLGIVFAGAFVPQGTPQSGDGIPRTWWIYALVVSFGAGIVATGSRAAIVLLLPALIALALRGRASGRVGLRLAGAAVVALTVLLLVLYNPLFARSFGDFSNLDDPREHFWPNVVWAISHFGWFGTGAGTFDGVYRSVETLETVSASYLNHAHNEYLEIALETGFLGILLLICFLAYVIRGAIRIIRATDMNLGRSLSYAGLICIGLLMLHSLVDYPLRTALLSTVFGFCCGLISPSPASAPSVAPEAELGAEPDS